MQILWVFIGGGLGSVLRYGIASLVSTKIKTEFPFATLISNFSSCLLLALLVIYFNQKSMEQTEMKLFLLVGLCGGFSTFSTFSFETLTLVKNGNYFYAIANVLISLVACIGTMSILFRKINTL